MNSDFIQNTPSYNATTIKINNFLRFIEVLYPKQLGWSTYNQSSYDIDASTALLHQRPFYFK